MAFDGITVSAIKAEIEDKILGGRIDKVYQPEKDEIILGIRSMGQAYKLLLTSNASNPKFHFTQKKCSSPPRYLSAIAQAVSGETAKNIIDKHVILEIKVLLESTDLTYRK